MSTTFDSVAYIKAQNEKESAARTGIAPPKVDPKEPEKPKEPVAPVAAEPDEEEHKEQEHQKLPRSVRRELNRLREEKAKAEGMLAAFQAMGKTPAEPAKAEPAVDADAKPERDKYATEAEFAEAIGLWAAKQESKRIESNQGIQQRMLEMDEKAKLDIEIIPNWAEHAASAESGKPNFVAFSQAEHPTLALLISTSEYKAWAVDYFFTHPDELEEMMELTKKTDKNGYPVEQIAEFRALEGHLKRVARGLKAKGEEPKKEEPKKEEPKAKIPPPSESIAPRGGSAPPGEVSPYLADGRTMNPAWKEARNIREGLRR